MGSPAVLRLMREFQPIRKAIPLFFGNGPFRMAKVLLTALVDLRSANGPVRLRRAQHPIGRGVCAFGANSTDSFWRKKSPQASFFDKPRAFREAPGRLWLYSSRNTCRINGCAPVTGSMSICITSFMYSFHRSTTALRACT